MPLFYNLKNKNNSESEGENERTTYTQKNMNEDSKVFSVEDDEIQEIYNTLIEDKFSNLSIENKLLIMHKTAILRSRRTDNYILLCLILLVIIAIKLYSN